ncbi:MAG: bifunctional proline dehydrogenase/L-glutamate gamma-semialdehyde dehydrogenase PutA [Gammaproteobacteria bacterium]|nr:bifunctional proline dehydrogenase/L-glutamate gamma-semialdehyde dehydrogenase PutA [Gammaproteobacteria bacterium]
MSLVFVENQSPKPFPFNKAYRMDENQAVQTLLDHLQLDAKQQKHIDEMAAQLVTQVRHTRLKSGGLDAFLASYDLSTDEGIALMCIAEAMLRIPDKETIDALIRDKLTSAQWSEQVGKSDSLLVNMATWALMLTGKILQPNDPESKSIASTAKALTQRVSEPVIRKAVGQAMKIMAEQFVVGATIDEAVKNGADNEKKGYTHSFDMLGESARTMDDAERYFVAYQTAIKTVGAANHGKGYRNASGVSIKLSALYPRYEFAKREIAVSFLTKQLLALTLLAKQYDIGVTVDAEESERLEISLEIIRNVFEDPNVGSWEGFGLAIQGYQKRCFYLIDYLHDLAKKNKKRLMVRLVKGAYWDSEIKRSQEQGLEGYPVFTRKINTDVSYLACAKKMLSYADSFYPQFATHNPQTLAVILEFAGTRTDFEFQCLHGMGQSLYDHLVGDKNRTIRCRIYAPVGIHKDLLPYLVRRLLENGANTSFVHRIMDKNLSIADIIADPIAKVALLSEKKHPRIPVPHNLYQPARNNSHGIDFSNAAHDTALAEAMTKAANKSWLAEPLLAQPIISKLTLHPVTDPAQTDRIVGYAKNATIHEVEIALQSAANAAAKWANTPAIKRAEMLEKAGELFEQHHAEFMYLAIREAGKTIPDALAEVREAVDFCYYYAEQAREKLAQPVSLVGPTGETNQLFLQGRGPIVCISPWNFPLAIFAGQVMAALVAGNPVIAKPAEQTPLIAALAVRLLHQAGIPRDVLQLMTGSGRILGTPLVKDQRVKGVIFTGSTEVAKLIQMSLAQREGDIVPLIAETGGQNCMLVDSSALPEQVVEDVLRSAFGSAGQRCSALRVLYLQDEIADRVIPMLAGSMACLTVADPGLLSTDIGPVIDPAARQGLLEHIESMKQKARLIYQVPLGTDTNAGSFVAPTAFEINDISQLKREVFGPILHVIRYKLDDLDKVLDAINNTGYGLTFGIQSRLVERIHTIQTRLHVGNCYVNRNMIGAVVGVQPFGGEGLSGTGPKAGGPHYITRLCVERTLTINTTASGGNASLLSLAEESA